MCGIAGYVSWEAAPEPAMLRTMERSLAHRGPDEGSIWCDGVCGLAHRRLRIIDLSACAGQPMPNETANLRVTYNGEIYNFLKLRRELEALGHTFKSNSDTEVLLHGYESWGEQLFAKLRGMFALALWDQTTQRLILARDRLGKKPLFFADGGGHFVFGSELTVFRALPHLSLSICPLAFRDYIEFGYVQSPRTILKEVRQLPGGHFGVLDRRRLSTQPFWRLPEQPDERKQESSVAATAARLDERLHDAVACRLISDVPLGCFLSGGVDSSLVAAHAQELVSGPLKTFTVGFKDSAMNEAPFAAEIARHLGTDHHEMMLSAQSVIDDFADILANASEPIGDDSFLPTFIVSRETRREVTVALSGDGGDELFCGYGKYKRFAVAQRLRRLVPSRARAAALSLVGLAGSDRVQKSLQALAAPDEESVARWLSTLWKPPELDELLGPERLSTEAGDAFHDAWNRRSEFPVLERFMLTDMKTYLTGDILAKVDRASMAHGLEVRNPLLDQEFIAAALGIPERARPGKLLLKEMLASRVPRPLFDRPKGGFGMPVNDWYRGPLRHLLERYTAPDRIAQRGLLKSEAVQRFVQAHLSGRRNFGRKLHAIVAFEIWADRFFSGTTNSA